MSYYINEKLFEKITSGKPIKKKKVSNHKHMLRGKSFTVVNRTLNNGNGMLTSQEFKTNIERKK